MAGIAPGLPLKQITMTKQNHSKTHSNLKTCFLSVSSLVYSPPVFQSHLLSSPKLAATANKALRSACCDLAADMSKHFIQLSALVQNEITYVLNQAIEICICIPHIYIYNYIIIYVCTIDVYVMLKPFNMSQDVSIGRAWWHGRPSDILWCHPSEPLCLSCSRSTGTKRCSKSLGAVDMVSWAVRKQAEFWTQLCSFELDIRTTKLEAQG